MSDDEQRIARAARQHRSSACELPVCWECDDPWPCDTAYLLDRLATSEATVQALRLEAGALREALLEIAEDRDWPLAWPGIDSDVSWAMYRAKCALDAAGQPGPTREGQE